MPQIGHPVKEMPRELRELIFGRYVVRYEEIFYISSEFGMAKSMDNVGEAKAMQALSGLLN